MCMVDLEDTMRQIFILCFHNGTELSKIVSTGNIQFRKGASNSSVCFLKKIKSRPESEKLEFKIHADQTIYNVFLL